MKNSIYFILLVALLSSCAAPKMISTTSRENIINVTGSKNDLYIKANDWMIRSFNNAKNIIQFQDKEAGKIVGKYTLFSVSNSQFSSLDQTVSAIVTIMVKENAAKINIEPSSEWKYGPGTIWAYTKEQADLDINNLSESFKAYMGKSSTSW